MKGYKRLGHNREHISKRAVRGSGGLVLLIKDGMFSLFSTDTADKRHEDIVWVSFITLEILMCVCYTCRQVGETDHMNS